MLLDTIQAVWVMLRERWPGSIYIQHMTGQDILLR